MISKLTFLISEGIRSIARDRVSSIVSCLALAVSLLILSLAYFCSDYLFVQKNKITKDYEIEVFFNECVDINANKKICYDRVCKDKECNKEYILYLNKWFENKLFDNRIYNGEFIDQNKSSLRFEEKFGEDIEEIFSYNPLPMSCLFALNSDFRNENEIRKLINEINKEELVVDEVVSDFYKISKVEKIINMFFAVLLIIELVIVTVVVFYISNTIQLVIYSKKDDMEVLKLLGASNNFIRFPYVFEGMLYGFIGSLISLLSIFILNYLFIFLFEFNFFEISKDSFVFVVLINIIVGPFLGFIASSKALTSYIRN